MEAKYHPANCNCLECRIGCMSTKLDRFQCALRSIQDMTEEPANSRYSKAAGGDTLGAEIHRIATEALNN